MRAIYRHADRRIDLRAPDVKCADSMALIRVTRAAASPSDHRRIASGPATPGVLGSECVGIVESPGTDGAPGFPAGSRVAAWPVLSCGACERCNSGLTDHCENAQVLGISAPSGCFAERVCVPAANLARVPDTVDDEQAVFACAVASALRTVANARLREDELVTVIGDGAEALLAAQVAATRCASVRLLGTDPRKVGLCAKWGVKHRMLDEAGRHADQHAVIVVSDSNEALDAALNMTGVRGRVVVSCGYAPALGADAPVLPAGAVSQLASREISIIGSRGGRLIDALIAIETGKVSVEPLIDGRSRLSDGAGVLDRIGPDTLRFLIAA